MRFFEIFDYRPSIGENREIGEKFFGLLSKDFKLMPARGHSQPI